MAWEKRFREYGVLKIDKNNVRVHSGPQQLILFISMKVVLQTHYGQVTQ